MIPYPYSRTFQTGVLICLVLTKKGTNVDSAMYSSGNCKVGKTLQIGFDMAYNMCHKSNKVTLGVVILHNQTGIANAGSIL